MQIVSHATKVAWEKGMEYKGEQRLAFVEA